MQRLLERLRSPLNNEKGISDLIVLIIILPIFLGVTVIIITFFLFIMRQSKLDDIKDRALQMVEASGQLTPQIINDTKTKLAAIGFPSVVKNGVTYPTFTGSTLSKVLRDDADPTVTLKIQYPATDLAKVMAFFGAATLEEPGYYSLSGYGRSEEYE